MKKLVRKIEEDFSIIGKDYIYPTQFIIRADELNQISDMDWIDLTTGNIFIKKFNTGPLEVEVDGLIYQAVSNYDTPELITDTEEFTDGVPQKNGKLGFFLCGVKEEVFDYGLSLEDGMDSKKLYPNEQVLAVSNDYAYDGESEKAGLKCMTSITGKVVFELFYGTSWYASKNHINYNDELVRYMASEKIK